MHAKSIIVYNGTYFKVFHHEGERAKAREKERDRDCSIVVVCVFKILHPPLSAGSCYLLPLPLPGLDGKNFHVHDSGTCVSRL